MKKLKKTCRMILPLCIALLVSAGSFAEPGIVVNGGSEAKTAEETAAMAEAIVQEALQDEELMTRLAGEVTEKTETIPCVQYGDTSQQVYTLSAGGQELRFLMETWGNADDRGLYPVYITLHGGGGGTAEENNDQWIDMFNYYRDSVDNGIYIAVRGISDTWDLHFREGTYPLLDALITYLTVTEQADPNRVYLLGFSAGGDGVYQLAPRMADRFAAVNMSSGHPNGVSLINLANCPICLQAGIRDYYSESAARSVRCAEFEKTLTEYRRKYGFGYEHQVWIHVPEGHNFVDYENGITVPVLVHPEEFAERAEAEDMLSAMCGVLKQHTVYDSVVWLSYFSPWENEEFNSAMASLITDRFGLETEKADTGAVGYVSQFVRDPMPSRLVWDLGTRAASRKITSFYWLQADPAVNAGVIRASFDRETNTYTVEPDESVSGDFAILFLSGMADTGRPVKVVTPRGEYSLQVNPSEEMMRESFLERMDPNMICVGKILYSELTE